MGRLLVLLLVAAAFAVPASTASAGRADVPAKQWVNRVCGQLTTWEKALEKRTATFTKAVTAGSSLSGVKRSFVAFLDDAVSLSDGMIDRVDAVGTPDVPKGATIRRALHSGLVKLRRIFAEARADAAKLTVASAKRLGRGMQTIGNRIQTQASGLGKTFDQLDKRYPSKQLERAFDTAPRCRSVS